MLRSSAKNPKEGDIQYMISACFRYVFITVMFVFAIVTSVVAQESVIASPKPLQSIKAGVYLSPPFVMEKNGHYTGMAIELWEMLAQSLGVQTQYVPFKTFDDLVSAGASGDVDITVTNLTITRDRAEQIDFTHPWFDAGLRIMVNEGSGAGFRDMFQGLQASGHLRAYAWITTVIIVATILLTLFDRKFDENFPKRWREGVAESFYTVMSVATSGKPVVRKNLFGWVGRIWQGLWLVCGLAVLAYVTSSITSVMTTLSLSNQISSVADLPGRPVAVFTGSVAEQYARRTGLNTRSFPHIEEAVQALASGDVVAILGDAPVLEYYAHTNKQYPFSVVGAIFEPDKYGFGLPHNSTLTRALTVELIGAHEHGQIEKIRQKYFGDSL